MNHFLKALWDSKFKRIENIEIAYQKYTYKELKKFKISGLTDYLVYEIVGTIVTTLFMAGALVAVTNVLDTVVTDTDVVIKDTNLLIDIAIRVDYNNLWILWILLYIIVILLVRKSVENKIKLVELIQFYEILESCGLSQSNLNNIQSVYRIGNNLVVYKINKNGKIAKRKIYIDSRFIKDTYKVDFTALDKMIDSYLLVISSQSRFKGLWEMKREQEFSKYLSYLLRHHPEALNLEMLDGGWVNTQSLIEAINKSKSNEFYISLNDLKEVVANDKKGRYSFKQGFEFIRANQGHSIKGLVMDFEEVVPPDVLYHGTSEDNYHKIIESGCIKPMSRQLVHLSKDFETAIVVGKRHGKAVVISIDSKKMNEDGIKFNLSTNGVYLVDTVPVQYFTKVEHSN